MLCLLLIGLRYMGLYSKLFLALLNVLLISIIIYSASLSFSMAQQNVPENSIFYRLFVNDMNISLNGNSFEVSTTGTGSFYLLKNDTQVRSGSIVTYESPLLNDTRVLTETSQGIYSLPFSEKFVITPAYSSQDIKTLKFVPKGLTVYVNGYEKYNSSVNGAGTLSALDYVKGRNIPVDTSVTGFLNNVNMSSPETATYGIPVEIAVRMEVTNNGEPLANTTITYSLPYHDYEQAITTDANGIAELRVNETVLLTISNGNVVTLTRPIEVPSESSVESF